MRWYNYLLFGVLGLCLVMSVNALNVTDDLDMNRGDIFNVTQIQFPDQVYSKPVIDIDGVGGTPFLFTFNIKSDLGTFVPFDFDVEYNGTTGGTLLATQGSLKASKDITGTFNAYGDRRTIGVGASLLSTQGLRNYYGQRNVYSPPLLFGGDLRVWETYHPAYSINVLSGSSEIWDLGYYSEPPSLSVFGGSPDVNFRAYGCGDYSNGSNINSTYCFYSPYPESTSVHKGSFEIGWLSNGTDNLSVTDLINFYNNPPSGFVYDDWFDQGLNSSDDVSFNTITTDVINSESNGADNQIELVDISNFCMDFTVGENLALRLCEDSIEFGDSILPPANLSFTIGESVGNWYLQGSYGTILADNYIASNGAVGIDYEANLTDSNGNVCYQNFTKGLMTASNCSGVAPAPVASPDSPFLLGIDEEDDPKSRLPVVLIP